MIRAITVTNETLTVTRDEGITTTRNDHPRWKELIALTHQFTCDNGIVVGPANELLSLLSLQSVVENYSVGTLSVNSTGVTYKGKPVHSLDTERVMAFLRDGLPFKPIANFIARKLANVSARAIQEMYNFLEHRGMPLTPEGKIIAYKGVLMNFYSVRGNKGTVVIQGVVNEQGQILNTVGSVVEVERSSVDDNFKMGCSFGLHAGSLAYARGWGERVVLVEIDPADVVSVPEDCNCQKLRCCKYKVVGEYTGPMPDTFTNEFSDDDEDACHRCGKEDCTGTCGEGDSDNDSPCPHCGAGDCSCEWNVAERESDLEAKDCDPVLRASTYDRMMDLVSEQLGMDKFAIEPDTKMDDPALGIDSLDAVELSMAVEEEFGFEIPDVDMETHAHSTFSEIVKYVDNRLSNEQPVNQHIGPNARGHNDGCGDAMCHRSAKYLEGDADGADSEEHANYIRGYVRGYASIYPSSSPK